MAFSPEDLLGTPSGYATPDQVSQVQQYANLLMKGGQRDKEITSPWQGGRMLIDALSGNMMRNQMGQQQQQGYDTAAAQRASQPIPGAQAPGPQASLGGGPASIRNNNPGGQWPGPVASQFGATGSQTIGGGNQIATFPDPISGAAAEFALLDKRYTGMPLGTAISKWSGGNSSGAYAQNIAQKTGLTPNTVLTPELLRSPQGVALGKAMAEWEAGGKSPLTDQQWAQAHQKAFGGQTADLSGGIGGQGAPPAGSPQAMSGALAANTKGPSAPAPGEPPMATHGNPNFGPEYTTPRPQVTQEQFYNILRNPWIQSDVKEGYYKQYLEQNFPVETAAPGGRYITPRGGKPLFQGDIKELKEGDFTVPAQADEQGNMNVRPLQGGGAPGGGPPPSAPSPVWGKFGQPGGAPPTAPPGPQSAAPPPPGAPGVASAAPPGAQQGGGQLPPSMLSAGSMPPGAQQPVRVASLDPTSGVGSSAQQPPPPSGGPSPTAATPPSSPAGSQVAQAQGQPGPLGDYVDRLKQWDIGNKVQEETQKTQAKSFAEDAEKERVGLNEAATKSATGLSQLQTAKALLDDPNLSAGFLFKVRGDVQKAKAWLGNNPKAARANEVFDKVIASQTLPELSAQTKQMGQVRLAELQVVQSSLASRNLTPDGAKAVLDIMMNAHRLNMDVSDLANSFAQGWRLGPDGKPYQSGQKGLNSYEWQPTLQKFLAANPVISPEMRANWEKNFGSNLEEAASKGGSLRPTTTGHPQPMATPAPGYSQSPPLPPGNWRTEKP